MSLEQEEERKKRGGVHEGAHVERYIRVRICNLRGAVPHGYSIRAPLRSVDG